MNRLFTLFSFLLFSHFSFSAFFTEAKNGGIDGVPFTSSYYSTADQACTSASAYLSSSQTRVYGEGDYRTICGHSGGSNCWGAYDCGTQTGYTTSQHLIDSFRLISTGVVECDNSDPVTGLCYEICEDGYLSHYPELGIDNCDRPDGTLQTCPDTTVKLSTQSCDSEVCTDLETCEAYALTQNPACDTYLFTYESNQKFELVCTSYLAPIDSGDVDLPDSPEAPDPVASNPFSTPDSSSNTAGDIAGSIQQALATDFFDVKNAINQNTTSLQASINTNTNEIKDSLDSNISELRSLGTAANNIAASSDLKLTSINNGISDLTQTVNDDADLTIISDSSSTGDLTIDTAFSEILNDIDTGVSDTISNETTIADSSSLKAQFLSFFPQYQVCTDFTFPFIYGDINFKCERFEKFKNIFGWFISLVTIYILFSIALQRPPEK